MTTVRILPSMPVLVAAILIIVIGTIRLIGSNANTVFSNVASSVQ
jgi:Flp pilus assembly pilin Flp